MIAACIKKKTKKKKTKNTATGEFSMPFILILKMEEKLHFQHIMLYYFKKGKDITETHIEDLCSVEGKVCD